LINRWRISRNNWTLFNFYRVNRKYLIQLSAIKKIKAYAKSKLLLEVEPVIADEIIISQESVAAFKEWMGS
jgi:two-component system LytT family response regulator